MSQWFGEGIRVTGPASQIEATRLLVWWRDSAVAPAEKSQMVKEMPVSYRSWCTSSAHNPDCSDRTRG